LQLIGYNDDSPVLIQKITNETTFSGANLEKNRVYEWNLISAVAMGSWNEAVGDFLARSYGQVEGSHVFTTGE
jgi:hypothetical protein